MRLFFTIVIAVFLLGGTYAYTKFASRTSGQAPPFQVDLSDARYSLEVIRTFTAIPNEKSSVDAAADPVAPKLGPESICVFFKGKSLMTSNSKVPQSERVVVESIPDVEVGANEVFVRAHVQPPKAGELAAMQASVMVNGRTLVTSTFAGVPGSPWIYGTIVFEGLKPSKE
jgi:hypothetical protein